MLRINQLKLPPSVQGEALKQALYKKTGKILGCTPEDITQLDILKCSIDARKKPDIVYSYTVDVQVKGKEDAYLKRIKDKNQVQKITPQCYHFPKPTGYRRHRSLRTVCRIHACSSRVSSHSVRTGGERRSPTTGCGKFLENRCAQTGIQCTIRGRWRRYLF